MSEDTATVEHDARATAARALGLLDLTDLSDNCAKADIDRLVERAVTPHGKVAAICIWPRFVKRARKRLGKSGVRIATVVNFPAGGTNIDATVKETRKALKHGADEIDLVMPWKAFCGGDHDSAAAMISAVAHVLRKHHRKAVKAARKKHGKKARAPERALLKVILETGEIGYLPQVRDASRLAIAAGADFIKTSTGKVAVNATPEAARVMLGVIATDNHEIGFKPAGGIRTVADAAAYLALADHIVGPEWADPRHFRFGASGLLDAILAVLDGGTDQARAGY